MTFSAHKLVHSEQFLDYLYELRHLLSVRKKIYIAINSFRSKHLRWNCLQISQLSIRSGTHKLFR